MIPAPDSDPGSTPSPPPPPLSGIDPRQLMAAAMRPSPVSSPAWGWEPPPAEQIAPLFPEYKVTALIGRGSMGAVYRAVQKKLDRAVAIKLLPAEIAAQGDLATRFEREARTLAKLSHPNIVSLHDFGSTAEGNLYIVMEYVEGTDLGQIIHAAGGERLNVPRALEIVRQICDALQYAHGRGLVHRDIKPGNVLVDRAGTVKVADFGLAKLLGTPATLTGQTVAGTMIGTPEYIAPEQLRGGDVDHRADIYSLGVMFYEMLTGDLPRGAWQPPSQRVPAADARMDEVVTRAMQQEPDRRYQQASEVKGALNAPRIHTPPVPVIEPKPEGLDHLAGMAAFAGGIVIAALLLMGIFGMDWPISFKAEGSESAITQRNSQIGIAGAFLIIALTFTGSRLGRFSHSFRSAALIAGGLAVLIGVGSAFDSWSSVLRQDGQDQASYRAYKIADLRTSLWMAGAGALTVLSTLTFHSLRRRSLRRVVNQATPAKPETPSPPGSQAVVTVGKVLLVATAGIILWMGAGILVGACAVLILVFAALSHSRKNPQRQPAQSLQQSPASGSAAHPAAGWALLLGLLAAGGGVLTLLLGTDWPWEVDHLLALGQSSGIKAAGFLLLALYLCGAAGSLSGRLALPFARASRWLSLVTVCGGVLLLLAAWYHSTQPRQPGAVIYGGVHTDGRVYTRLYNNGGLFLIACAAVFSASASWFCAHRSRPLAWASGFLPLAVLGAFTAANWWKFPSGGLAGQPERAGDPQGLVGPDVEGTPQATPYPLPRAQNGIVIPDALVPSKSPGLHPPGSPHNPAPMLTDEEFAALLTEFGLERQDLNGHVYVAGILPWGMVPMNPATLDSAEEFDWAAKAFAKWCVERSGEGDGLAFGACDSGKGWRWNDDTRWETIPWADGEPVKPPDSLKATNASDTVGLAVIIGDKCRAHFAPLCGRRSVNEAYMAGTVFRNTAPRAVLLEWKSADDAKRAVRDWALEGMVSKARAELAAGKPDAASALIDRVLAMPTVALQAATEPASSIEIFNGWQMQIGALRDAILLTSTLQHAPELLPLLPGIVEHGGHTYAHIRRLRWSYAEAETFAASLGAALYAQETNGESFVIRALSQPMDPQRRGVYGQMQAPMDYFLSAAPHDRAPWLKWPDGTPCNLLADSTAMRFSSPPENTKPLTAIPAPDTILQQAGLGLGYGVVSRHNARGTLLLEWPRLFGEPAVEK